MDKTKIIGKFGKLFASDRARDGVLQGIHYAADGSAVVTNRHYLLRIQNAHSFKELITLHAKMGQPIEGAYPDTNRIFPSSFKDQFLIPHAALGPIIRLVQAAADAVSRLYKDYPGIKMTIDTKENLEISFENENLSLRAFLWKAAGAGSSVRTLNAKYLATALSVFDAADSDVTIKLNGPHDAIVLSSDDGEIDVLILPYRVPYV